MVEEAQDAEIPFEYVLSDTGFSKPVQLLVDLKNVGTDVIAMVAKTLYKIHGRRAGYWQDKGFEPEEDLFQKQEASRKNPLSAFC